jgi:hypothetical protein
VDFSVGDKDDLAATLGNFTFNVVVAGECAAGLKDERGATGQTQIAITSVGIFMWDSFDFEGDQSLGYWDDTDNSVSYAFSFSVTETRNANFRDWRDKNGRGGDFLVYSSDVKVTTLTPPDIFLYQSNPGLDP